MIQPNQPIFSLTDLNVASIISALNNQTRLAIIDVLARSLPGTLCNRDIAAQVGVTSAAASQQLQVLVIGGIVARERRGNYVHYGLRPGWMDELEAWFKKLRTLAQVPMSPTQGAQ